MLSLEGLRYLMTNTRVRSILLMAVYTLSPIDLLPEIVLGPLGLIDDFAVALNIVRQASGLIQDFMREEN